MKHIAVAALLILAGAMLGLVLTEAFAPDLVFGGAQ